MGESFEGGRTDVQKKNAVLRIACPPLPGDQKTAVMWILTLILTAGLHAEPPIAQALANPVEAPGHRYALAGTCIRIVSAGIRQRCIVAIPRGHYIVESAGGQFIENTAIAGTGIHIGFTRILHQGTEQELAVVFLDP